MQVLPPDTDGLQTALSVLRRGGVVAHATETCYGLACDISNPDAVLKLFQIKHRSELQPVSALFSSIDEAKKYVEWNEKAEELAAKHLPGPLTLILPVRQSTPFSLFTTPSSNQPTNNQPFDRAQGGQPKTVGVRISSHPLAQQLVTAFGKPITTTSANLHGQRNPYDVQTIIAQFESQSVQPDLILDSGTLLEVPPSTVMDLTGEGNILRVGGVKPQET